MKTPDTSSLPEMPNIGPELEKLLRQAAIDSPAELRRVGAVGAAYRLAAMGELCFSKLYAMEGALRGVRWHAIPKEERDLLKTELLDLTGRGKEKLSDRIARVLRDEIHVVPYDRGWPELFEQEKERLLSLFPNGLIDRVEHYGSTSVPGLPAKPVVDILAQTPSLARARKEIVPKLQKLKYDYFWRSSDGSWKEPFYAWFIRRDGNGRRTHHIHLVEPGFPLWDNLLFRDYLREHPDTAVAYAKLKKRLAEKHREDREAYTSGKSAFIQEVMARIRSTPR